MMRVGAAHTSRTSVTSSLAAPSVRVGPNGRASVPVTRKNVSLRSSIVSQATKDDGSKPKLNKYGVRENPNSDNVQLSLDGVTSGVLVFAVIAFQFFILAFVDLPSIDEIKRFFS